MLTLGDRLELEDDRRFVGREQELSILERLLLRDAAERVVLLYGPGGIGKSTLLRRLRRLADRAGWPSATVDGRYGALTSGELEARVLDAARGGARLIIIDTYERLASMGPHLRASVLPRLPADCAVVLAQRGQPEPGWLRDGWENLVRQVELGPVSQEEALELLRREGIYDQQDAQPLLEWAHGSPLALSIGADALRESGPWRSNQLRDDPELAQLLVRRLTDGELSAARLDVVTVAAIARRVDEALFGDVLPGIDGAAATEWLCSCTFSEPLQGWVTLHELVRSGVRAQVRRLHPARERELRRRLVDHLYHRAASGETGLIPDLAVLVENETLRWALGGEGPAGLHADDARPEDLAALASSTATAAQRGAGEWLATTMRLVHEAPSCVLVARDESGAICGICIFVTPGGAPPAADRDPVLGPWLAHARSHHPEGNVVIWRDSLDLTERHGDSSSSVLAVMNSAAFVRCGLANPRYAYLPIDPANPAAVAFSKGAGAVRIEGLDVRLDERVHECHVLDHGPGGLLAAHRATVYAEIGARLPPAGTDDAVSAPEEAPTVRLSAEAIKDAVRNIDRPLELARSPLARGETPQERADSVRALLAEAAEYAFGADPEEQLLRELLRRRYLGPPATHERVAESLHVSRATYFRHLRVVLDRVADYVLQTREPQAA